MFTHCCDSTASYQTHPQFLDRQESYAVLSMLLNYHAVLILIKSPYTFGRHFCGIAVTFAVLAVWMPVKQSWRCLQLHVWRSCVSISLGYVMIHLLLCLSKRFVDKCIWWVVNVLQKRDSASTLRYLLREYKKVWMLECSLWWHVM